MTKKQRRFFFPRCDECGKFATNYIFTSTGIVWKCNQCLRSKGLFPKEDRDKDDRKN